MPSLSLSLSLFLHAFHPSLSSSLLLFLPSSLSHRGGIPTYFWTATAPSKPPLAYRCVQSSYTQTTLKSHSNSKIHPRVHIASSFRTHYQFNSLPDILSLSTNTWCCISIFSRTKVCCVWSRERVCAAAASR